MAITLTADELTTLESLETQARAKQIPYWQIYEWLADRLDAKGVPKFDSTLLWLRGATEANAGRGAMSELIRVYTESQHRLRYGEPVPAGKMQEASDAVAQNLIDDVLGRNQPAWPRGAVPDIARIAVGDATAVGDVLFRRVPGDTAASPTNSAWSGALLFSLLRSDQTDRLVNSGQVGTLDTLSDIRDLLFATASYAQALRAANSTARSESTEQLAVDANTGYWTGLSAYLLGPDTLADLWSTVKRGAGSGIVGDAVKRIAEIGPNRFLDMVLGSIQGRALLGTTTDANFESRANAFFSNLATTQLQGLPARLLPTDASSLASLARADVNVRAALEALSIVCVQVSTEVAGRFELFQESTGQGSITDAWISDRSAMLEAMAIRYQRGIEGVLTAANTGIAAYSDGLLFEDASSATLIRTGSFRDEERRLLWFGKADGDTKTGTVGGDRMYAGAGDDSVSGLAGADYIEGNSGNDTLVGGAGNDTLIGGAGSDTYSFVSGDGYDIIRDGDGLGRITVQGFGPLDGLNAKKVAPDAWQTADRSVNYTLVQVDSTRRDLYITFADRNDVITIENWSETKNLGITFEQSVATSAPPPTDQYLALPNESGPAGGNLDRTGSSSSYTVDGTPEMDQVILGQAADVIIGNGGGDHLYGMGGNDQVFAGAQVSVQTAIDAAQTPVAGGVVSVAEGGTGDDLLIGTDSNYLYGGAGKDTIIGGGGVDLIQGDTFSGGFREAPDDVITVSFDYDPVKGKYTYYARRDRWGQTTYYPRFGYLDTEGSDDVIYSGAGNDIVDGELGDDRLVLGEGDDIGLGREGNDTVIGEGGNDFIIGDFNYDDSPVDTSLPEYLQYNYAGIHGSLHGDDLLSGGAGSDTIQGNGGADTILGGDGDDLIRGDDLITPAAFHGADSIDAGAGNDEVEGGALGDTVRGGAGNDILFGDGQRLAGQYHAADVLYGDDGADTVVGGGGADTIYGGSGDDALVGDNLDADPLDEAYQAGDQLFGQSGKDTLVGGGGADLLDGGTEDDALFGDAGDDTLIGGAGADYLDGGAGNDTYVISASDATLNGQGAADTIVDSAGLNRVVLTDAQSSALSVWNDGLGGLVVDFGPQSRVIVDRGISGAVSSYTLGDGSNYRFTELIGSFANGPITAADDSGRTYVMGGRNADSNLVTTAAGQVISGGRGDDSLRLLGDGGATVIFRSGDGLDSVYVNPDATQANTLSLGEGISAEDLRLRVTNNSRVAQGTSGGWGAYIGTAQGEGMFTGRSADQLLASSSPFSIFTFSDGSELTWQQVAALRFVIDLPTDYNVTVKGTAFGDEVTGDWGNRMFNLGDGDDIVTSGRGSETFFLGKGADTLVLEAGFGHDTVFIKDNITDSPGAFVGDTVGIDTIRFKEGLSASDARMYRTGDNLVIRFQSGGEQLTVKGFFIVAGGAVVEFENGPTYTTESIPLAPVTELATEADDNAFLTPAHDFFDALAGNDTVNGWDGNDTLAGGAGNDYLHGALGDDALFGDVGDDSLSGAEGADLLDGGPGNDYLDAGSGNNTYAFGLGDGTDRIDSFDWTAGKLNTLELKAGIAPAEVRLVRDGDDVLVTIAGTSDSVRIRNFFFYSNSPLSSAGRDYNPIQQIRFNDGTVWSLSTMVEKALTGTDGSDAITGTRQSDSIQGGAGNDTLMGNGGNDTLRGGEGNDELIGDVGSDVLDGGAGNDVYRAGGGTNTIQFGKDDGNDLVWYEQGVGATGTIAFKSGVLPSEVMVRLVEDSQNTLWPGVKTALELSIEGTTDTITVNNFTGPYSDRVVQQVRFADGTTWNVSQILTKQLLGTSNDDYLIGTTAADLMRGRAGNDQIFADAGNDTVHGDAGDDYIDLGDGDNVSTGGDGADGIFGGMGNDSIAGDAGDDYLGGYEGNDTIRGGSGNDTLEGDRGDDLLEGGTGDDVIWGSSGTDIYLFGKGDGFDTIYSDGWEDPVVDGFGTLQFKAGVLPSELSLQRVYDAYWEQDVALEISIVGTTDRILVSGFFLNNDPSSLENPLQQIRFDNGQVWDLGAIAARATGTFVNQAPTLVSPLADQSVNEMVPFSITVPAGAFADPDAGDVLTYSATLSNGDPLPAWLSFNAATRTLSGTTSLGMLEQTGIQVTATDQAGASASDVFVINVATQNLSLTGTSSANTLSGRSGNDTLSGSGGNDTLYGNAGDDSLNGGTGTDSMIGGVGNDVYVVDVSTDIIVEGVGEGNDSVSSTVTYTLPANVENLTLTGTTNIHGTGNVLANRLTGNSGANSLSGGDGNDTIDGGSGSDTMIGGNGDDVYYVNVATDVVTEAVGGGTDTIFSSVTLTTLAANVENITLTGTSNRNATGNALANVLIGNSGANSLSGGDGNDTIDGGAGNDTMVGGNGDDTFFVNVSTDVVTEAAGGGTDTVMSAVTYTLGTNVENLTLTDSSAINGTGNTVANLLTGNLGANTLTGNAGTDTLDGGAGNDSLVGGADADVYRFGLGYGVDTVSENDATANVKDAVQFVGAVTQSDVQFKQVGNNLEVLLNGTSDKIVVQNWYLGSQYQVEEFRFTDGTILTNGQAQGMVTAGASASAMSMTIQSVDLTASSTRLQVGQSAVLPLADSATWIDAVPGMASRTWFGAVSQVVAGQFARLATGGASTLSVTAADVLGRKSIQLPGRRPGQSGTDASWEGSMPTVIGRFALEPLRRLVTPVDRTVRATEETASEIDPQMRWSRSQLTDDPTQGRRMRDELAMPDPLDAGVGEAIVPLRVQAPDLSLIVPVVQSEILSRPASGVTEARKTIQPAEVADVAEHAHEIGSFDQMWALPQQGARFRPDIVSLALDSNPAHAGVAQRQASTLVEAMAVFSAGLGGVQTQGPMPYQVPLESVTMPGLG